MIGQLRGRPGDVAADGSVVVDVGGVGYEVMVPLGTLGRAPRSDDGAVTLHVHTHVREDTLELFGFATIEERDTFRTLLGISKVGPKLAIAVLSALALDELCEIVATGQVARLVRVPGVGKKTADRLVLELKGKLEAPRRRTAAPAARAVAGVAPGQAALLQEALVRMGFKQTEAERAVGTVADLDRPMGELLREALAVLAP
jgi:holliday junction DNA helicase RuvA